MGAKNLAPTGIRSPDRPTRSEGLYRLSYSGPKTWVIEVYIHSFLASAQVGDELLTLCSGRFNPGKLPDGWVHMFWHKTTTL